MFVDDVSRCWEAHEKFTINDSSRSRIIFFRKQIATRFEFLLKIPFVSKLLFEKSFIYHWPSNIRLYWGQRRSRWPPRTNNNPRDPPALCQTRGNRSNGFAVLGRARDSQCPDNFPVLSRSLSSKWQREVENHRRDSAALISTCLRAHAHPEAPSPNGVELNRAAETFGRIHYEPSKIFRKKTEKRNENFRPKKFQFIKWIFLHQFFNYVIYRDAIDKNCENDYEPHQIPKLFVSFFVRHEWLKFCAECKYCRKRKFKNTNKIFSPIAKILQKVELKGKKEKKKHIFAHSEYRKKFRMECE